MSRIIARDDLFLDPSGASLYRAIDDVSVDMLDALCSEGNGGGESGGGGVVGA